MDYDLDSIRWPATTKRLAEGLGYKNRENVNQAIASGRLHARQPEGPHTPYMIDRGAVEDALASGRIRPGRGKGRPPKSELETREK